MVTDSISPLSVSARVPPHRLRLLPDRPRGAPLGDGRLRRGRGGRHAGGDGGAAEGGPALPGQAEEEEEEGIRELNLHH